MTQNMASGQMGARRNTYTPLSNVPVDEWVPPHNKNNTSQQNWKVVKLGIGSSYQDNSQVSKRYFYNPNYKDKNPMTRTQLRRYQRQKKTAREAIGSSISSKVHEPDVEAAKRPVKERIFLSMTPVKVDAID